MPTHSSPSVYHDLKNSPAIPSYLFSHLRWKEGQRSLDEETHQPLGVEDELVSTGLFISATSIDNKTT